MSVQCRTIGGGKRRTSAPGAPVAEVVIGPGDQWPVGVVHVTVPPGGGMAAHDHGSSDTLLIPVVGELRIVEVEAGDRVTEFGPGMLVTIPTGERVRLENTGEVEARMLVVLSPPDFAERVSAWPEAVA